MSEPDHPHEAYCNASRRIPIGGDACSCRAGREIKRLRMFLAEISAMGPADEEWDANTLDDAVALAKRALNPEPPK